MHPAAQVTLICAGVLVMLAGAFVLAMLGAFLWGAAKQKSNQKIRDLKALLSVRQNTKEIEDEVDLLSDDALNIICTILGLCEQIGEMPTEVASPVIALIPKPKGDTDRLVSIPVWKDFGLRRGGVLSMTGKL